MRRILFGLFTLSTFLLQAQVEPGSSSSPRPREKISQNNFSLEIIGSFPIRDFGSEDVRNEDAGFAKTGGGVGFAFRHFSPGGLVIGGNLGFAGRQSTVLENFVSLINDTTANGFASVSNEARYNQIMFLFGPGLSFGSEKSKAYLQVNLGGVRSTLHESSLRLPDGTDIQFDSSSDWQFGVGGCFGLIIDRAVYLEAQYLYCGEPTFELVQGVAGTRFSIPVELFNVKLGFIIAKSK